MKSDFDPKQSDELEQAIRQLPLATTSESHERRMAMLFAGSVSAGSSETNKGTKHHFGIMLFTIAASLLIGFGAGVWYSSPNVSGNVSSHAGSQVDSQTQLNDVDADSNLASSVSPAVKLPETRTVSRSTTLSTPVWLQSKDGQRYRSYIAHTTEDVVEIDPVTQKKTLVQRHIPRFVISKAPGI